MIQAYGSHYADNQAASGAVHWSRTERRMEHRLHTRVEIAIPARLHFRDGAFISGLAVNLSQGGIFIKTPMWAWRDGCVDVRMHVQGFRGDSILRIPSFIVHRDHGGMGLMFREIDAEAVRRAPGRVRCRSAGEDSAGSLYCALLPRWIKGKVMHGAHRSFDEDCRRGRGS